MLFVTGATDASDMTVYFNITPATSDSASSTSMTSTSSASSSATTKAELSPTSSVSYPSASTTASAAASQSSSDLNASAKIGLGVGIPAAAIVGVLASWLVFRRRRAPIAQGHQEQPQEQPQEDQVMPMGLNGFTGGEYRPASKAMTYGPAPSTCGSVPLPSTDTVSAMYEASNKPATVSELYAPTYRS